MGILDDLKPKGKPRVFDLVKEAGVDVSDWANYSRGARWAATNPKYCYDWAFVEPDGVVVLNLWHQQLSELQNAVVWSDNLREWIRRHSGPNAKAIWRKRADAFERAVSLAYREGLPVRVIVNDGRIRKGSGKDSAASRVDRRQLDPVPWAVTSYEQESGSCTITRGVLPKGSVDQFDLPTNAGEEPERRLIQGMAFKRDSSVRTEARRRAEGKCEYCSSPGFALADGRVYVETHHVIPLHEGGRDAIENVVALCPNHHREAHHGSSSESIRGTLLDFLARKYGTRRRK